MSVFSERLKTAMQRANLTSAQLSKATGIGRSSISQWLSDKYVAKNDKVLQLAAELKVDPQWLLGTTDEMEGTTAVTTTAVDPELNEIWQALDETGREKLLKKARKQLKKSNESTTTKKQKKNKKKH